MGRSGGGGSRQWQTPTHTHTHTHTVSYVIPRVVEPRSMIRSNHDTCRHGPPLIKLMGYEHQEDAMRGRGSKQCQIHTHTQTVFFVIHRVVEPRSMIRTTHDTCRHGLPLIKLTGYEHREDAVGGGGSKQCQIHTHTHTKCPS